MRNDIKTTSQFHLTTYYVWGRDLSGTLDGAGGVGGLLATEVGGVWYFPLYDNNGNVTDYVSETGEVVASYEYDAFGRTIAQSGAMADMFPFRFSTKYYDAEAKLYYYGERFYSPEMGRWLNRDPIEEDGGDNLYAFCGNNGHALCLWLLCWRWRLEEPSSSKRLHICFTFMATNRQAGNAYPKIPI